MTPVELPLQLDLKRCFNRFRVAEIVDHHMGLQGVFMFVELPDVNMMLWSKVLPSSATAYAMTCGASVLA